jgi:hypothetical protein
VKIVPFVNREYAMSAHDSHDFLTIITLNCSTY